jgi:thymidine kinase
MGNSIERMSKLYFRYGAMNSGKSTTLLQAAHNYEERGQAVLIAKPAIDAKGGNTIVSRLGVAREVDFAVEQDENLRDTFAMASSELKSRTGQQVACLLLDEVQFLTRDQIDQALEIAVLDNVPVLAFGIRTDFMTVGFPGSIRLLEIAHSIEELKTICRCGRKAMFNARKADDEFIFVGNQVALDGFEVTYESLCAACYFRERDSHKN